ncbi:uncharacterized protein G2W53_018418 [Senna tora]|uniref:RNase H type-1 domain-containing protein n=1 Tax=Senna tora TaxID=362788 RepID=A0A834WRK5_9FABA|nr:uncharacterized protein G2W53_018418 [Senna tora]
MATQRAEGGTAGGPSVDRTTTLLAALTARRAAQEKAREAGTGGTPEQGSKLLQEEIQEMRQKMGNKEGQGDNSKKQDTHKSGSRKSRSSKWRGRGEKLDRSSSESRSGESSSSSQSTDFTPPKKKRRYPFVDSIMEVVMPKLRTPTQLKHYDGASDPVAHVNSFKAAMLYAGAPDEVMCRAFPSTLDGDAQLWFSDLPSGREGVIPQGFSHQVHQSSQADTRIEDGSGPHRLKKEGNPRRRRRSLLGAEAKDIRGKTGRKIGGTIGAERSGDRSPTGRSGPDSSRIPPLIKGRQEGTGDRRDQRLDDRNHRGNDQRHREDNTDTVAGTIHVIAGGIVRGTEADPHTRKRQVRSVMRVMNAELVDPREREEERRPNPEGEMEAMALAKENPTRTTKVGVDLDPSLRKSVAEYEALIAGLRLAKELGAKKATVHSDSQLVVGQLRLFAKEGSSLINMAEEKMLKELDAPPVQQAPLCITTTTLQAPLELKSGLIHLLPKFRGLANEDPYNHLKEFHVVCSSMKPDRITEDPLKLRAFPFSLEDALQRSGYSIYPQVLSRAGNK